MWQRWRLAWIPTLATPPLAAVSSARTTHSAEAPCHCTGVVEPHETEFISSNEMGMPRGPASDASLAMAFVSLANERSLSSCAAETPASAQSENG